MARQAIQIDKIELEKVINSLEESRVFSNRGELWKAIEETDFAKNCQPRPLTFQVAMLLCQKYNIEPKTPKGKKGRNIGEGFPSKNRGIRASKKLTEEQANLVINIIPKDKRENYSGLIQKVQKGSMKALVHLKCLDCSNWQREEVRNCTVKNCPLYVARPYKQTH